MVAQVKRTGDGCAGRSELDLLCCVDEGGVPRTRRLYSGAWCVRACGYSLGRLAMCTPATIFYHYC
jgi:hypothetical protein